MDDCFSRESAAFPPPPALTKEFFSDYYDFLVELKTCVEDQGEVVADPPSREAFIESEGTIWHPYEALVGHMSEEDFAALERACPQNFTG